MTMGLVFISLSFVFTSCRPGGNGTSSSSPKTPRDRPPVDPSELSEKCPPGGGECAAHEECKQKCSASSKLDGLFRNSNDKKDCYKLTVNEVDNMFEAFGEDEGFLADGEVDLDDLSGVCASTVKNMLRIDDKGKIWEGYISDYEPTEAYDVAYWLADNEDIFKALNALDKKEDVEDLVRKLLKKINSKLIVALRTDISEDGDGEYFLGLAADEENRGAVRIAHNLASTTCVEDVQENTYTALLELQNNVHLQEGACMLGEVYCVKDADAYIFDDFFETVLKEARNVKSSLREHLNLNSADQVDLETVCKVFCAMKVGNTNNRVFHRAYACT